MIFQERGQNLRRFFELTLLISGRSLIHPTGRRALCRQGGNKCKLKYQPQPSAPALTRHNGLIIPKSGCAIDASPCRNILPTSLAGDWLNGTGTTNKKTPAPNSARSDWVAVITH